MFVKSRNSLLIQHFFQVFPKYTYHNIYQKVFSDAPANVSHVSYRPFIINVHKKILSYTFTIRVFEKNFKSAPEIKIHVLHQSPYRIYYHFSLNQREPKLLMLK